MEKKQNVPALRFQGFSGEWKRKTLGDFGNVAMNRRIFKEQTSETGEIPFYKIGTFGKEPDAYISRQLFEEYKAKYPYPDVGDILLSAAGSIGKTVEYTGKDEYFQDSNIVWLKHDERLDNPFLKYFYLKVKWGTLEGGTVKRLYNKILLETEIVLPEIIEQKKIGKFFASYDRMIAHQEGKIRKLQQFRQAMLAKLFPREGAAEPELRFRGFSGKWRIRTLAKCAALHARIGWQNLRKSEFLTKGDYYLITGTDFVDGQIEWRTCHYVSKLRYDQDKNIQVQNGDILVTKDGTLGKVAYVDGADKPATLNAGVFNVKINVNDVDAKYLYQYLKGPYLMDYVNQRATGGTIKHLNQNILVDFPVVMPSFEEQKIIGDFFYRLDRYISLQQKKLERMQRLKAALLEKLFV